MKYLILILPGMTVLSAVITNAVFRDERQDFSILLLMFGIVMFLLSMALIA